MKKPLVGIVMGSKSDLPIMAEAGAAHLPGVIASMTTLPVIGVPIRSSNSLDGWDSILSILQMPSGVPVATVALNGAQNAGILAAQIVAHCDGKVASKLKDFKKSLKKKVERNIKELEKVDYKEFLNKPGK
ncbi:MAG: AIR carboxylase family protein [Ignavibacteriales bacterium]|nr:AIR carboxylase family protein [Ignavibacteriales bacterium]